VDGIASFQIPPGIPVHVASRPNSSVTTVACTVRFGSRHDPAEYVGLAHMLEHLMLRPSRAARDLSTAVESFGGEVNAITSKEDIFFYCRVPPANALDTLDLLSEWIADPALPLGELEREKGVIIEELRAEASNPADAIYDVLHAGLFPSGGLARPPGGTVEGVDALTPEVVAAARGERIHPGTVGFVVVGPTDPAGVVDRLLSSPVTRLPVRDWRAESVPSPAAGGTTTVAIPSDYAYVGLAVEAFSYADPCCVAAEVLAALLGGSQSSLLFRVIRSERGLAYSVVALHRGFVDTGVLRVEIGTSPASAGEVHDALLRLVTQVGRKGWAPDEVERAKRWYAGQLLLEAERSFDEAFMLSRHRLIGGLENWTLAAHLARVRAVTPQEVNSVGERLFQQECASAVVGGALR
jgi:predicted Zn-dependent peptidase